MADRLTLAHAIEDAGIERTKAEALAGAILEAIHDNVATKIDIRELRSELKADIQELRSELKADIQELRSEMAQTATELRSEMAQLGTNLRSEMTTLRADMALVEQRLLTRLGGLIVVLLGLLFAALHAWPPGHG